MGVGGCELQIKVGYTREGGGGSDVNKADHTRCTICTYFHGVQFFATFANEPQTAKINTYENLSWHCFATCIRLTAISWTPKATKTSSHSH